MARSTRRWRRVAALRNRQVAAIREHLARPGAERLAGAQADFLHERRRGSFTYQPFEAVVGRFPSAPFNYGGELELAQGAVVSTIASFAVPPHMTGVLRELVFYSTLPGGVAAGGLTAFDLLRDQEPLRGHLAYGSAPGVVILPDATLEEPVLLFNERLEAGQTFALRIGRVGATDPTAYTYRARLRGWFWPRYKKPGGGG